MSLDKDPDLEWYPGNFESEDDPEFEWDYLCDSLTEMMEEINPGRSKKWHIEVTNFGWNNRSGYADITADKGRDLLQKMLPQTECSFKIWKRPEEKMLIFNNAHHDKPTGGEIYQVSVQKEEQ